MPYAFFCEEPNILIIDGAALEQGASERFLQEGRGLLQISGVGFRGFSTDIEQGSVTVQGFSPTYHWLYMSPRIFFVNGHTSKVFHIKRSWWHASVKLQVDNKDFLTDGQKPLIIVIGNDGNIVEIESLKNTFGVPLESFLQMPTPLLPLSSLPTE